MDQHLISVDELRAAGALDVPAKWRKSLAVGCDAERDLFSGLFDEDDSPTAHEESVQGDSDRDEADR